MLGVSQWLNLGEEPHDELRELSSKLPEVLINSKANNTYKNYNCHFKNWCKWCVMYELSPVSSNQYYVALYIISLMQNGCSSGKIDQSVYAIKWAHQLAGKSDPCDSFLVRSVAEGAKRMVARPTTKKEAISPDIILRMVQMCGQNSNLYDIRTVTMCLLAYSGFLRFSELANLRCCDVVIYDLYVALFIEKSKTDQHRDGNWVVIAKINSPACPVNMLLKYIELANITLNDDSFLFRQVSFFRSTGVYKLRQSGRLSYTRVRELFMEKLALLGLDTTKYGLHSLRSGGATAVANRGVSDRLFKKHGRWRSDRAKGGYVQEDLSSLLSVSMNLGL